MNDLSERFVRLYIAQRTASKQVHAILAKLGVQFRHVAAEAKQIDPA